VASLPLILSTGTVMLIGLWIPFTGVAHNVDFIPLPIAYFAWLGGILLLYAIVAQTVKDRFIRRYGFN
jgi:Mg2+-importing ATPase